MDSTLKLTDLVKDGLMVRFFWVPEHPQRQVGIHSYSRAGETISSGSLNLTAARARWCQLVRAGWSKD